MREMRSGGWGAGEGRGGSGAGQGAWAPLDTGGRGPLLEAWAQPPWTSPRGVDLPSYFPVSFSVLSPHGHAVGPAHLAS